MNRRRYLALLSVAGSISGCSTDSAGEPVTASQTPTSTRTPTNSPTPGPRAPTILFVNPVTRWREYGDASANRVSSIGKGSFLPVAARYRIWNHDGTIALTKEVEFLNEDGDRVA